MTLKVSIYVSDYLEALLVPALVSGVLHPRDIYRLALFDEPERDRDAASEASAPRAAPQVSPRLPARGCGSKRRAEPLDGSYITFGNALRAFHGYETFYRFQVVEAPGREDDTI